MLGAYPSALHVKWLDPAGERLIEAIAVGNEPTPFWAGEDQKGRIAAWVAEQGIRPEWGSFERCEHNGASGTKLNKMLFEPLRLSRLQAWITDCLDEYHQSRDARRAMSRSAVLKMLSDHEIVPSNHRSHPLENQIVAQALEHHLPRLRRELATARPQLVVTLGNAALRVFRELAEVEEGPLTLSPELDLYGKSYGARIKGRLVEWLPLAHPAAPSHYQKTHEHWKDARKA